MQEEERIAEHTADRRDDEQDFGDERDERDRESGRVAARVAKGTDQVDDEEDCRSKVDDQVQGADDLDDHEPGCTRTRYIYMYLDFH